MTIVIALTPGERGSAAFQVGTVLARSAGDRVVVAAVVPTPWPPCPFLGEAEYLAYAERTAEQSRAGHGASWGVSWPPSSPCITPDRWPQACSS